MERTSVEVQSLLLSIGAAIALFAVFALAIWLGTRRWMSLGKGRERRERALRQFRAYTASSPAIAGENSQVVAESESGAFQAGRVLSYSLTLLAKTVSGQYYMYVANDEGQPYVKLLTPEEATRMKKSMRLVHDDA